MRLLKAETPSLSGGFMCFPPRCKNVKNTNLPKMKNKYNHFDDQKHIYTTGNKHHHQHHHHHHLLFLRQATSSSTQGERGMRHNRITSRFNRSTPHNGGGRAASSIFVGKSNFQWLLSFLSEISMHGTGQTLTKIFFSTDRAVPQCSCHSSRFLFRVPLSQWDRWYIITLLEIYIYIRIYTT